MFNFSYTGRKDARFTCLNPNNLDFLQQCAQAITQAPAKYCGVIYKISEIQHQLNTAIASNNSSYFKFWKDIYVDHRHTLKQYQWYLEQQKILSQSASWQELTKSLSADRKQECDYLHKQFSLHEKWAHYSSAAIYDVAFKIIPYVECYFSLVEAELTNYPANHDVKNDLNKFVADWQQWLSTTRISLSHAMAARLVCASHYQDLTNGDVLHFIISKLNKIADANLTLPTTNQVLAPEHITSFQSYIARGYCKQAIYQIKHQVSWLSSDEYYTLQIKDDNIYILPRIFLSHIANSKLLRWWHKLLGYIAIDHYCQEQQYLFAACRMLHRYLISDISEDKYCKFITDISRVVTLIRQQLAYLSNNPGSVILKIIWYFFPSKKFKLLLSHWHTQLIMLMDKSLQLLTQLIVLLESDPRAENIVEHIHNLHNNIAQLKQLMPLTAQQQANLDILSKRYTIIYDKLHAESNLIDNLFKLLSTGKLPGKGKLKPLYDYLANLKLTNQAQYSALQIKHTEARSAILKVIITIMRQQSLHMAYSFDSEKFIRALYFLQQFGDEQDVKQLTIMTETLFKSYICSTNQKQIAAWHHTSEAMLLIICKQFDNNLIYDKINQLRNLRLQSSEDFLASCKQQQVESSLHKSSLQAMAAGLHYETAIWQLLAKNYNNSVLKSFKELVKLEQASTISNQRIDCHIVLLKNNILGKKTSYWLEQLIWIQQAKSQPPSVFDYQAFQQTCIRRTTVILSFLNNHTKSCPQLLSNNNNAKENPHVQLP